MSSEQCPHCGERHQLMWQALHPFGTGTIVFYVFRCGHVEVNSRCRDEVQPGTAKAILPSSGGCTCSRQTLMASGCRCGAMARERAAAKA